MRLAIALLLWLLIASNAVAQERDDFFILLPFGYDFLQIGEQNVHRPAAGIGFLSGDMDEPFDKVERRFFALALYQPLLFREEPLPGLPNHFHRIDAIFDGRIYRHQLLLIFRSAADKPIAGGLGTFETGIGWGYELVRRQNISLILGAGLAVSDFGPALSLDRVWPVLPLPLIRFNVNTQWFTSSFDFLTGPNFSFTVAPQEKIRFTADMRMDQYRTINDLIFQYTLWYRLFNESHRLGDFAGIGIGIKNDSFNFLISRNSENFELQKRSIFGIIDLSLLRIESGWIYDSNYLIDGRRISNPGSGFYASVQGIVPVSRR
ncbi:MAG: hypothetical protein FWD82_01465 [Defluviitaleaceae bacterium]|nr:hypothetical protein [Defluviitaleaceae bacterium]